MIFFNFIILTIYLKIEFFYIICALTYIYMDIFDLIEDIVDLK